ncbi:MAG: diguanylate cyclase [Archangiaceae bacterium]|nr:diguanylate cyclase [Archangiaceae bacterium]
MLVPGVVAVGLVSLAFLAAEQQRRDGMNDLRLRRVQVLQAIGLTAAVHVAQNDMADLDTLVALFTEANKNELLDLAIVDDDGRVLANSRPELFNTVRDDAFTRAAVSSETPVWAWSKGELSLAVPARAGIRWATVVTRWSLEGLEASISRTRAQWLGVALALFLVLGAILYLGLDRLVVAPIRALQRSVKKMEGGSLDARAPKLSGREFSELSDNINHMAQALQSQRENLERAVQERTHELQELNGRLERLAVTDGLTGVFNHRRFQEQLASEVLRSQRTNRPLSVLMIDVDLFKRVNDSMGHPAGDELLRRIAQVVQSTLRQTDLLARYGGEEFAVVLPETPKGEGIAAAERARQAVEEQVNEGARWTQKVTVSVGVATWPDDGTTPQTLLVAADQALYTAKRAGRNRVVPAEAAA